MNADDGCCDLFSAPGSSAELQWGPRWLVANRSWWLPSYRLPPATKEVWNFHLFPIKAPPDPRLKTRYFFLGRVVWAISAAEPPPSCSVCHLCLGQTGQRPTSWALKSPAEKLSIWKGGVLLGKKWPLERRTQLQWGLGWRAMQDAQS